MEAGGIEYWSTCAYIAAFLEFKIKIYRHLYRHKIKAPPLHTALTSHCPSIKSQILPHQLQLRPYDIQIRGLGYAG